MVKGCVLLFDFFRFVNFAILRDNQRPGIALAGCPIPDPEGPYDRDPLPTIYPPTTTMATTGNQYNTFYSVVLLIKVSPNI